MGGGEGIGTKALRILKYLVMTDVDDYVAKAGDKEGCPKFKARLGYRAKSCL